MDDWAFLLVQNLVLSTFLVVGMLALFLPQRTYFRLLGRFLPVSKTAKTRLDPQRRLAGLALAAIGLYGLNSNLRSVLGVAARAHASALAKHSVGLNWLAFASGLVVVTTGIFLILNPGQLVRWSQEELFPSRQITEGISRTWSLVFRLAGALMVLSSEGLFKLWLRS